MNLELHYHYNQLAHNISIFLAKDIFLPKISKYMNYSFCRLFSYFKDFYSLPKHFDMISCLIMEISIIYVQLQILCILPQKVEINSEESQSQNDTSCNIRPVTLWSVALSEQSFLYHILTRFFHIYDTGVYLYLKL